MSEKVDEEILTTLKDILKWIKFMGQKEVRTVLMNSLDTEQKRLVYHLSDGKRGSIEIGKTVRISDSTVRQYWKAWSRIGIMETVAVQGGARYKKSFDIEDFGLDLPRGKTGSINEQTDGVQETISEDMA